LRDADASVSEESQAGPNSFTFPPGSPIRYEQKGDFEEAEVLSWGL